MRNTNNYATLNKCATQTYTQNYRTNKYATLKNKPMRNANKQATQTNAQFKQTGNVSKHATQTSAQRKQMHNANECTM